MPNENDGQESTQMQNRMSVTIGICIPLRHHHSADIGDNTSFSKCECYKEESMFMERQNTLG